MNTPTIQPIATPASAVGDTGPSRTRKVSGEAEAAISRTSGGKGLPGAQERVDDIERARQEPDRPTLDRAVTRLSEYVQQSRRDLQFSIDDQTGRPVIRVYDAQSRELIRQIPPEELLEVVKRLEGGDEGTLLQVEA
ncbi:MAG TPA: flagellar protein FlaG [Thiotrichales bacterium]|nr:flagellar protein FlaG [Thiotrichales bacterium]